MFWRLHLAALLLLTGCAGKSAAPDDTADKPPPKPAICAVRSPELCLQDGIDLYNGLRGTRDPEAAIAKFELACAGDDQRGCTWLGIALRETRDSGPDQARAISLWNDACDRDVMMACTQLGSHLMSIGWQQADEGSPDAADTFQAAIVPLKRACGADPDEVDDELWGISVGGYACGVLATVYEHGFGVETDLEFAWSLNVRSCDAGWPRSCAQVGYFLERGLGVPKALDEAAGYFRRACDEGDAMGCHRLGLLLLDGRGTEPDPDRAAALLRTACDDGYTPACEALSTLDE